jgi:hypothetical protein
MDEQLSDEALVTSCLKQDSNITERTGMFVPDACECHLILDVAAYCHVLVTTHGVCIADRIYWTFITRNYS